MYTFQKSDLIYKYSWTQERKEENLRINDFSSNCFLYRGEGYEMLPFIKKYMKSRAMSGLDAFHNLEEIIKNAICPSIASHEDIKKWLDLNYIK